MSATFPIVTARGAETAPNAHAGRVAKGGKAGHRRRTLGAELPLQQVEGQREGRAQDGARPIEAKQRLVAVGRAQQREKALDAVAGPGRAA